VSEHPSSDGDRCAKSGIRRSASTESQELRQTRAPPFECKLPPTRSYSTMTILLLGIVFLFTSSKQACIAFVFTCLVASFMISHFCAFSNRFNPGLNNSERQHLFKTLLTSSILFYTQLPILLLGGTVAAIAHAIAA